MIGARRLTLSLTCIYGGGRVDYIGSTTHTKVKEPSLPYYLLIAGGRIVEFIFNIRAMWDANNLVQDLNSDRRIHFQWR